MVLEKISELSFLCWE